MRMAVKVMIGQSGYKETDVKLIAVYKRSWRASIQVVTPTLTLTLSLFNQPKKHLPPDLAADKEPYILTTVLLGVIHSQTHTRRLCWILQPQCTNNVHGNWRRKIHTTTKTQTYRQKITGEAWILCFSVRRNTVLKQEYRSTVSSFLLPLLEGSSHKCIHFQVFISNWAISCPAAALWSEKYKELNVSLSETRHWDTDAIVTPG